MMVGAGWPAWWEPSRHGAGVELGFAAQGDRGHRNRNIGGKAAARFDVGVSTAIKWVRRLRDTGERSARRQGRRPGSKLDAHGDFVRAVIDAVPDTTIGELQRRLVDERGVYASTGTIWTFLDRCDLTVKKKSAYAAEQDRPDVVEEREDWFEGQLDLDPAQLCSSTRALPPPTAHNRVLPCVRPLLRRGQCTRESRSAYMSIPLLQVQCELR